LTQPICWHHHSVRWFYLMLGLSISQDAEGNEVAQQDTWLSYRRNGLIGTSQDELFIGFGRSQDSWRTDLWFQWMVLSRRFSSWDASKGELSFPWNLLLYGYKTIIPSPAGDSVLLLGPVTRLVSKLSREDRTIGLSLHHLQSRVSRTNGPAVGMNQSLPVEQELSPRDWCPEVPSESFHRSS
jgi:hypothetical protein